MFNDVVIWNYSPTFVARRLWSKILRFHHRQRSAVSSLSCSWQSSRTGSGYYRIRRSVQAFCQFWHDSL